MMLDDLIKEKRRKLEKYEKVRPAYPARVRRDFTLSEVADNFEGFEGEEITLAGRVMARRDQGKIIFAPIDDGSGRLQLVMSEEKTGEFALIKETLDVGDFVEAEGQVMKTARGEKSLEVKTARIIAKNLRPLPQEWFGIEDVETRLRERYLDVLFRPEVKEMFVKKSRFWDEVRVFMKKAGFLEVELPILESVPGGAEAEPFVTHMNALDRDFYLRISLELPLKKLLVGGYDKVFEIGRIFRNEGIDKEHLQDYTQLECYWAYADYNDMMKLTEKLYKSVIKKVFGTTKISSYGYEIDWARRWKKIDYYKIFKKETGIDLKKTSRDELFEKARELGLEPEQNAGKGRLIDLIFKTVRKKIIEPSFLIDPPVEMEPLAKRSEKDPSRVERFQIMAAGTELGKGFSELNDPTDQRKRFEEQMRLREAGDKEAQRLDEEYLRAVEYGMPPSAGFGMSERVFAVLVDKPVRETVIFPLMREKGA
ncbi:MAG: lysine--tRNA ligase [Candidatus Brennerbacteria bacterium]|nr:lysine--tRNA ligase [Candidatus Brennerbacteria bacterium]